jgi:hypothetical protein
MLPTPPPTPTSTSLLTTAPAPAHKTQQDCERTNQFLFGETSDGIVERLLPTYNVASPPLSVGNEDANRGVQSRHLERSTILQVVYEVQNKIVL